MKKLVLECFLRCVGVIVGAVVGMTFGAGTGIVFGGGGGMAGVALFTAIGGIVGFFMIPDLKWIFRKLPVIGASQIFR